jgi:hypothetical protein
MPVYYKAKLAADEVLTVEGTKREGFGWIDLRPARLADGPESGKVHMGKVTDLFSWVDNYVLTSLNRRSRQAV